MLWCPGPRSINGVRAGTLLEEEAVASGIHSVGRFSVFVFDVEFEGTTMGSGSEAEHSRVVFDNGGKGDVSIVEGRAGTRGEEMLGFSCVVSGKSGGVIISITCYRVKNVTERKISYAISK
jgi:hypothetical protein